MISTVVYLFPENLGVRMHSLAKIPLVRYRQVVHFTCLYLCIVFHLCLCEPSIRTFIITKDRWYCLSSFVIIVLMLDTLCSASNCHPFALYYRYLTGGIIIKMLRARFFQRVSMSDTIGFFLHRFDQLVCPNCHNHQLMVSCSSTYI